MWLNRFAKPALVLLMAMCIASPARSQVDEDGHPDYLDGYRNNGPIQGLYEIRAAARDFLKAQPPGKDGPRHAGALNLKMQVPRCVFPLQTRWATKYEHEHLPAVLVVCTLSTSVDTRKWQVAVEAWTPRPVKP